MKVAFFIGHHKTGSTALQSYLANNFANLLRDGILYPSVESQGSAANLIAILRGQEGTEAQGLNVREPHNALAFRLMSEALEHPVPKWHPNLPAGFYMLQMIEDQMNAMEPRHTIICSEVMSRFAEKGTRKIMPRMQARFGHHECSIVLNLRRIDEYLASWHLQRLKFGAKVKPLRFGAHETYYQTIDFRYDHVVLRWSKALPEARMVVRNYNDVMAAGGSVADFFQQSQIDFAPKDHSARANTSVPYAFAEIVRQANHKAHDHHMPILKYVLGAMGRVPYAPNSEVELFGPIHRPALLNAFAPIHATLSSHLGLEAFFPDIEAATVCHPIPEMVAAADALNELRKDAKVHATTAVVKDFIANLDLDA